LRQADSSSKSSLGVDDIREEQDEANGSTTQVPLDESDDAIETSLMEPDEESSQASPGTGSSNPAGMPARKRPIQRAAVRVLRALFASPVPNRRSVKRQCVVCGMDTRSQCSHGFCRSHPKENKGKMYYGSWICDPKVGARKNAQVQRKYPCNDLTCLQLHRREFKAQKLAEHRDIIS
jgi:hypothetical protein